MLSCFRLQEITARSLGLQFLVLLQWLLFLHHLKSPLSLSSPLLCSEKLLVWNRWICGSWRWSCGDQQHCASTQDSQCQCSRGNHTVNCRIIFHLVCYFIGTRRVATDDVIIICVDETNMRWNRESSLVLILGRVFIS